MYFTATFLTYISHVSSIYYNHSLYVPKYYDFLETQTNLTKNLFSGYDATISPVYTKVDPTQPLGHDPDAPGRWNYTLLLFSLKLVEVTEPQEKVSVVMEVMEYWFDARLTWNKEDYDDIASIYTRQANVWSPTLSAFGVSELVDLRDTDFRLVGITSYGMVNTYVSVLVSANCPMDVYKFPFDYQTCQIRFCIPVFTSYEVEIFNEIYAGVLTSNAWKTMGNSEWNLVNLTHRVETLKYDDGFANLDLGTFEIKIRRNPLYYIYMIIFPSFIINVVSIIGVFLKGADKMSKLNVGLTNIMTMTFILGVMADKIPRTGTIPLLGVYIITNLVIMLIAIGIVTVINELRRCASPVLKRKQTKLSRKLESFIGTPLEYTCAAILELLTFANFAIMIGFWLGD
ncbi:Neurotransmitter-gated ion-channel ligand-binding domain-containing protein [Caenorhabditis elegans]|uniref:Neurotransmitter-gated ion-channel ligand-binding domain-containing protein n=1 Tax=Caenorhabditis elegans TaxID=6239 RepID=Q22081_CAEEL|nr:Neurotransmitter-gated ion-channel ligand-binding domain-containing protein [Caenorhabditis elegans]CAA91538.2 Neurotransmitter-gated ion-channel ligand-binding domain-containing protein [Caenorhabditis elegans]|eukprot:NP_510025.2 Ligand-Gated ion Channel [Caenorhabditis elegans]